MENKLEQVKLTEEDSAVYFENGCVQKLVLVSKEIMAVETETGKVRICSPVRIQSCMHPEQVRIEPVTVMVEKEEILIRDLAGEYRFPKDKIELSFRAWTPKIPDGHCGDCCSCRRCWA